ncbi:MAG: glutamine amidotransferase [Pseudohongiellaceae bacterium]
MTKPVLILKTGNTIAELQQQGEDFEDWFREGLGLGQDELNVVEIHKGEALPPIASISAVIITGSPAYVTDLAPWNFVAAEMIRSAFAARLPMLGICYGHQLIAWAFGGNVDFHPKGREIGSVSVYSSKEVRGDELLSGLPDEILVNVSHLQSVLRLPDDAVPLFSNEFDPHHGFRLGKRTWCFQFHPEFDQTITRAYINARQAEIDAEGLDSGGLLRNVVETPESATILRRFMAIVNANSE